MILQAIHDISQICALKGVEYAVLSPGSRCAPLTISFARNPSIRKLTFSDERAAAFHALGIAQETDKPVVLVCTSGSAAYNYAPAVAEAYYQHIPLIILTADRPMEWIGQQDGQTIQQSGIYGKHVKKSYDLPGDYTHPDADWYVNRIINEAVNLSSSHPKGPVHVNVPLREPFYPTEDETPRFSDQIRLIGKSTSSIQTDYAYYNEKLATNSRILVVAGQGRHNEELLKALNTFQEKTRCTIVSDIIGNVQEAEDAIIHHDLFIDPVDGLPESHEPELLITFGDSLISKNLKLYLRQCRPAEHWHLQPSEAPVADTLQHITEIICTDPVAFFDRISNEMNLSSEFILQKRMNFHHAWSVSDNKSKDLLENELNGDRFNELIAVGLCMKFLPDHSDLHLANSMAVRYANFVGLRNKKNIYVKANRGTSGIDGSNSTAVGNALVTDKIVTLITGDLAFFYDRNAFWNKYSTPNLRIILLNNFGGGIFRMIKGPSQLEELEEFFVTEQKQTAKHLAAEFGLQHHIVSSRTELNRHLPTFFNKGGKTKILEIRTDSGASAQYLKDLKGQISKWQ